MSTLQKKVSIVTWFEHGLYGLHAATVLDKKLNFLYHALQAADVEGHSGRGLSI